MKLTAILTLALSLQLSARSFSQTVTITGKNLPLYDVFNSISKQTGYEFVYDEKLLKGAGAVNISVKEATLADVLDKCLKDKALSYSIVDKIIVISPKAAPKAAIVAAQPQAAIHGRITDPAGQPLINVSVQVKGTTRGAMTDGNGTFTLQAESTDVLVISYLGFETREVPVGSNAELTITLNPSDKQLGTVVVTALGVKREAKSITYATQQVSGVELTKAKDPNLMNTLNGKVAGLTISSSASGVGGSAKVILRGNKSGLGNNGALYVIDGVPMNNTQTTQPGSTYGGGTSYDGGDPISNINPDDIESISVLKGASAAALYGSQGVNGVILITTKSGKAGRTQVNFSSSETISQAAYKPKFQNTYGESTPGSTQSWGNKLTTPARDNLDDFFQTGSNLTNSISLSGGTEKMQTYFSYANTSAKGIEPNNKLARNNISFKETGHFLNDKLTASADVNYITQTINNTPLSGLYYNPLTGLYLFPRGVDITQYKKAYELPDASRNFLKTQNWPFDEDLQQNPWWIVNRDPNSLERNRILMNANLKYEIKPWLNIQARGSIDRIDDHYQLKSYAGTSHYLASANGAYAVSNTNSNQQYGDLIVNVNLPVTKDLHITGLVGGSILDIKQTGERYNSGVDGLQFANVFELQNFVTLNPSNLANLPENHTQTQSVFASANLSFKDWAYLDLTARNDWNSNLAFTPNHSYFYPSVGLNLILSEMVKLPTAISFAKVRGSFAQVGSSPLVYQTNPALTTIGAGGVTVSTTAPFNNLKPEQTNSLEFGTEWHFFANKLSIDATYYKTNTKNQTLQVSASQATYLDSYYINAGNIQNQGVEAILSYKVFDQKKFAWTTGVNFALNRNKVLSLAANVPNFKVNGASGTSFESRFAVGGSYGDIYGVALQKDAKGRILVTSSDPATAAPKATTGDYVKLGNANPDFQLGWNNNFTIGKFDVSMLIDGKFGGKVMSLTQAILDQYGVSKATGDARDAGGVKVNGVDPNGVAVTNISAANWYGVVGGRNGVTSQYMYDATNIRLRELSIGYTIPVKDNFVKALRLSAVGRNLIYFEKKAPFDPELGISTGNALSGVDVFMPPATRSYGLSLNATF
jgi:TonB-linked SusC/RagA family outer membrane protein